MTINSPLTIVIPLHNETPRLPACMQTLRAFHEQGYLFDVILVENGSTDDTYRAALAYCLEPYPVQVMRTHARGKGLALRLGVLAAQGTMIYTADCDFSTPLSELAKFIKEIVQYDVVIGSRDLRPGTTRNPLLRRLIGRAFHGLVNSLVPGIQDTQCGFKLYRAACGKTLFEDLRIVGMAYDVELLYLARLYDYRVKEIPVQWEHDPDSRVHLASDSWQMFWDVQGIPGRRARFNKKVPV